MIALILSSTATPILSNIYFAVASICDSLIENMKLNGAYLVKDKKVIDQLLSVVAKENV